MAMRRVRTYMLMLRDYKQKTVTYIHLPCTVRAANWLCESFPNRIGGSRKPITHALRLCIIYPGSTSCVCFSLPTSKQKNANFPFPHRFGVLQLRWVVNCGKSNRALRSASSKIIQFLPSLSCTISMRGRGLELWFWLNR